MPALIARWHGPLWAFVRRFTGNEDAAREILQDVWLRVIRGIARLRDGSKLRAWLFGIARRTLMDRLREQYARSRAAGLDVDIDEIPAEPPVDEIDDLDGLEHALGQLPLLEREAVTLSAGTIPRVPAAAPSGRSGESGPSICHLVLEAES